VQRLMDVADEVNGKFQRLQFASRARRAAQLPQSEPIQFRDNAVALIAWFAFGLRVILVVVNRNIHEMPLLRAGTQIADVIGPARDRCQRMAAAEQAFDHLGCAGRQSPLRDFRDDRVPFRAPSQGAIN